MQIWRYIFNFAYHTSLLKSHIFISILSHNSDICFFLSYFFSLSLRWAVLHYYLFVMLSNLLRFIFTSSFICAHTIYSSCLSNFIPGLFYMGMPLYVHTTTNWLRVAEPVLLLFLLVVYHNGASLFEIEFIFYISKCQKPDWQYIPTYGKKFWMQKKK